MATQYTPILQLALPVTGELNGTWGDVVNNNITSMVEEAIAGMATISTWTGNAHTLTTADGVTDEARCAMLVAQTGSGGTALTGAGNIVCPDRTKLYVLKNSSSYAVTLKTAAGTGVAVAAGDTAFLFCDGTNVGSCVTQIVNGHITGNLTVDGNATVNGNTTLGNATSDTVTVTARFASDLLPSTDNARDLGTAANGWRNLYVDSTATIATVVATNLQVTNIKANDGTAAVSIANTTGAITVSTGSTFQAKPTVQVTSAATNTVTDVFRVDSQSSGVPAAGIGVGIEMAAETAAGNTEVGVTLDAVTTDVAAGTEDFDFVISTMAAGAAAAERLRVKSTGQITIPTSGTYAINGTDVLSATTLGSGVTGSSLTSVGTIGTGTWQGTVVGSTYGGTGVNNGGRTLTINTNSGTLAFGAASKTLTINNSLTLAGTDATTMTFPAASTTVAGLGTTQTFTGVNTFTPTARTSGVASYFTLTTPADTGQTASTEAIGANFTAGTRTWATGALTTQRERVFAAPTYAFAGASTITTAVNVDIAAPIAGTNATITNAYALRAGATRLTSTLLVDGTSTLVGNTDVSGRLRSSGNQSVTAWTTTGQAFDVAAATFTDTSTAAAGVVASRALNTFNQPTLASTNAITVTNAANVYIANAPAAGTNTTITNAYSLWVDNGNVLFDGNLTVEGATTLNGGATLGNAAADALTITSNTATINNGLTFAYDDATTNTVVDVLSIQRTSSGTPANGIGAALAFKVETTASNIELGATIDAVVTDVTAASEDFALTFNLMTAGAAASEKMRIDSAGNVGIGTSSPGYPLEVRKDQNAGTKIGVQNQNSGASALAGIDFQAYGGGWQIEVPASTTFVNPLRFGFNGSEKMRLDSSGNLGLGVTPSAWGSSNSGNIQLQDGIAYGRYGYTRNAYYNGTTWTYIASGQNATQYNQGGGQHTWLTAPSGTAGSAISFTQAMTLDASGNLGIGTSSPVSKLHVNQGGTSLTVSTTGNNNNGFCVGVDADGSGVIATYAGQGAIKFGGGINTGSFTGERMRIDSSGTVRVSNTSTPSGNAGFGSETFVVAGSGGGSGNGALFYTSGGINTGVPLSCSRQNTGPVQYFFNNGTQAGHIEITGANTCNYATSSDYRLKENIQPMQNALAVVQQLNPVTYTWKADGSDGQGFIAHELQDVVPDCVTGEKDAVDEKGNPVYQGIDTSFLVATLTKAIQELKEELDATKAEVAALKGN